MRDFNKEPSFEGMVEVFQLVMDGLKHFRSSFGLTLNETCIILTLCAEGELTLSELCAITDMPKSTASRLVDGLVEKKMLNRVVPLENRRSIKISVDKQFRKKLEKVNSGPKLQEALLEHFSQEEGIRKIGELTGLKIPAGSKPKSTGKKTAK